jgi:hypothetical protein
MSYDLEFHKNVESIKTGFEDYEKAEELGLFINSDLNITFNLNKMFSWALDCEYWIDEVEGFKGSEVAPKLAKAISKMLLNKSEAEKYNSPNGWGTYPNALRFLTLFCQECVENGDFWVAIDR